jgi:Protein of unknown function (DUF4230)
MLKQLKKIAIIILICVAGWWVLGKVNLLPSFSDIFQSRTVVIDNTPILIKEIQQIAELTTAISYDEVVVDSVKLNTTPSIRTNPFIPAPASIDRIVLIARGKVIAGSDLQQLKDEQIVIVKDSVSIQLPAPKILNVIINPSDFETFSEKGNWSNTEVTLVKEKAIRILEQRAIKQNILLVADKKAKLVLEKLLHSIGFTKVTLFH